MNKSVTLPKLTFGTSALGNLYQETSFEDKCALISEIIRHTDGPVFFDTAGKYGAGLSLEVLGNALRQLGVSPDEVIISNKLGWFRSPLLSPEPTFEPGVWKGLKHDAVQKISYQGILECYHQGNALLNHYQASFVSVHDPDEYIAAASNPADAEKRYQDVLDAYRALADLKAIGKVKGVGIGAKDWQVIKRIAQDVNLDWVMIANSLTIKSHPQELIDFIADLAQKNIPVINSAIFNGGFLTGGDFFNYRKVDKNFSEDAKLLKWREDFHALCREFNIQPAEACYHFSSQFPGISSIAMSTTRKDNVIRNVNIANAEVPEAFWTALKERNLI